ncbi:MAG: 1-acyl-sn-glycerol-3-phosphate acyltransferase [Bacteroidota bacterium]
MKYEKWSLGYWFLKQYVSFADWIIHKKVIITGKEKIPKNKPIVFAPNHQNALSDPMAVLLHTRFQPVWLGRADLFGNSIIVDTILHFLKIMPVYRLRDGKANLEKNEKTFADSIKVLENNFALALFPEAAHSAKRQMLVHKKAVPRIVFMAEEKSENKLDIQIIPTGIYYSSYWKFNRTVIVNFGDPIPAKNYLEQYHENPNLATIALKTKIHKSILPLIINFKTKRFYNEFEAIREIYGPHFLRKQNWKFSTLNRFKSDQILANKLDNLETEKPEKTEKIAKEAGSLFSKIKRLKLRSWLTDSTPRRHVEKIISNIPVLLLGLPVFLYGFIFNALPFFITDQVVRKKVKDFSFWSTFFLGAGIVVFPVLYLLELLAVSWIIPGIWFKLLFLVSLPLTGKLAFKWFVLFRKTIGMFRYLGLEKFNPKIYHQLLKEKQSLTEKLDTLL